MPYDPITGIYSLPTGNNPPFPGQLISTNTLTIIVDDIAAAFNNIPPTTASSLKIGTTTVTNGTDTYILYNNGGVLGNEPPSALTKVNDTNVTLTLGGTPATALLQAVSLTLGWAGTLAVGRGGTGGSVASGTLLDNITGFSATGFLKRTGAGAYSFIADPLPVANGGTGLATLTAHAVLLGEGTSNVGFATIGTSGRLLIDQGAGADPSFNAMSGDATITNAGAITVAGASGAKFTLSGLLNLPVFTVSTLPSTGRVNGSVALVSDATSNILIGAGGGSAYALVAWNGAAWVAV